MEPQKSDQHGLPPEIRDDDWVGAYGFGGHHGPGYEVQLEKKRSFWERIADEFGAFWGDKDATRRLREDRIRADARHEHQARQGSE
ncbi:MAG TPA: hypothetical protein VD978_08930 [Azospirillum sp.]|nr:hypothetical protein [Azospirillum sp.]